MESDNAIIRLADDLKQLREDRDTLNARTKELAQQIQAVESELADAMLADEVQSFNHAGTTFYLSTKVHASPAADAKYELFDALRNHGFGSLIVETVNAQTLSSFIKEQREENGYDIPNWLDGLINVFDQTTVNMRRASR
jgi:hypothetical protein